VITDTGALRAMITLRISLYSLRILSRISDNEATTITFTA